MVSAVAEREFNGIREEPTVPEKVMGPLRALKTSGWTPEVVPLMFPPNEIPPAPLAVIVAEDVSIKVVGVEPAALKEETKISVRPVPIARPPPEVAVKAPRGVVTPIFPPSVALPEVPLVNVKF